MKDRLAFFSFLLSAAFVVFAYGWSANEFKLFPHRFITLARKGLDEFRLQRLRGADLAAQPDRALPWYYRKAPTPHPPATHRRGEAYPGLNLVTQVAGDLELVARILDMDGAVLHEWRLDWFTLWPDATHLPPKRIPKSRPGTHIHGAVILDNGDLVFNFEHLGLVRLAPGGEVVWRLPYQTHHSVHRHDDGNLWVCGEKFHRAPDDRFPHQIPPFTEHTVLEVTPDGAIVGEWSVGELLKENNLTGLLYLGTLRNHSTQVKGDLLHLNDVEPFPDTLEEGFFKKGDVLVSLRNINTVFVFNRHTRKISFSCTGWFVRQHDPDFIDGNRFSVFDNNNSAPADRNPQSRIVIVSAPNRQADVYFEGSEAMPFYTDIMGKHQWLPNGNLLITESRDGRAFELDPDGRVVWDYVNVVGEGVVGLVEEVQRLPLDTARHYQAPPQQEESKP